MFWETTVGFIFNSTKTLLFPPHCTICLAPTPSNRILCRICRSRTERIVSPFCKCCSEPFPGGINDFICETCKERRFSFLYAVSSFRFRGSVREVIHRIKYGFEYSLRTQAGWWLSRALRDPRIANPPPDILIPVPLHSVRRRERGFNQAQIITEWVSKRYRIPYANVLIRTKNTATQTGFDRRRRISNLRKAFILGNHIDVNAKHCVLVDDVFTTGSTLDACSRVLLKANPASIRCITVARG